MAKFQNLASRKSVPSFEKQPFVDFLQSRCPKKLRNINRKTLVLESLINNVPACQARNFIKK